MWSQGRLIPSLQNTAPAVYAAQDSGVVYFRLPSRPSWQVTLCSRDEPLSLPEERYIALCKAYWKEKLG